MNRPHVNQFFYLRSLADILFLFYFNHTNDDNMAESTGNESIVTPRRSLRLASKRSAAPSFLNFTFIEIL